jgi:allantoinase
LGLQAFLSRRIVTPEGIRTGAVLVKGERFHGVVSQEQIPASAICEDFGDAALLPGLVDSHVHINEPGRTEWEGFYTATRAAAAGGYTMLADMPLNSVPVTTNVEALAAKRAAANGKCHVDWAAWGGVVQGNRKDIEPLAQAGARGFKCFLVDPGIEEFTMVRESDLRAALPHIARTGLPLLVHAEVPGPIEAANELLESSDWTRYETYLQSRPDEAELSAIQLMLSLCSEYGVHLHIVHLTTGKALEMLRTARTAGDHVTVETCPHYLHLAAETISNGATQCKCAPPIRSRENREELWQAMRDGVIDMIVTDHSPCPPAMKQFEDGNFRTSWGGIASLSMALPVTWTEAQARGFMLTDIARWMSEEPARLVGCDQRKGRISANYDADFIVFDTDADFMVTEGHLHHRHAVSPYMNEKLRGMVRRTYLRGKVVFQDGEFPGEPAGREFQSEVTALSTERSGIA